MYNSKQKEEYLNQPNIGETTKKAIEMIFNITEGEEKFLKLDLSNFQQNIRVQEVKLLLQSFNSESRSYLKVVCAYFENYTNWCMDNGYKSIIDNPYKQEITSKIIDEIIGDKLY